MRHPFGDHAAVRWLVRLESTGDAPFGERPPIEWTVRAYLPMPDGRRVLGPVSEGFGRNLRIAHSLALAEARRHYGATAR